MGQGAGLGRARRPRLGRTGVKDRTKWGPRRAGYRGTKGGAGLPPVPAQSVLPSPLPQPPSTLPCSRGEAQPLSEACKVWAELGRLRAVYGRHSPAPGPAATWLLTPAFPNTPRP